jgi:hypothetical protein
MRVILTVELGQGENSRMAISWMGMSEGLGGNPKSASGEIL